MGERILRNGRAIVMQSCERCRWARQYQDDVLVQERFGGNEYRVNSNSAPVLAWR